MAFDHKMLYYYAVALSTALLSSLLLYWKWSPFRFILAAGTRNNRVCALHLTSVPNLTNGVGFLLPSIKRCLTFGGLPLTALFSP